MIKNNEKLEDKEIIKRCLNGDKDIFSLIIERYKNLVYSIILRMVTDTEDANDLAQEVFIKIYKNLDKYTDSYKLSTWIIRITTNHVIDFRRKKRCEVVSYDDMDYELCSDSTPEEEYLRKEQNDGINRAVDNLPDMYKVPIVLYHRQGLSYQEIADEIDEPLSKVKIRIFRGRKLLKESLKKLKEGGDIGLQKG